MGFVDELKQALGLDERGPEPSWEDRLVTAAYTPPSGIRITFDFEDVSVVFNKRTTGFNFPDADGTYVQDNGVTGHRFPLRCFFWGAEHDKQAAVFVAALRERGHGKLEHPLYGTFNVNPFGTITRRDDLVTRANQTVFEVVFWESIKEIYPIAALNLGDATLAALAAFNGSADFASQIDLSSAAEQGGFLGTLNKALDTVEDGLKKIAAVNAVVDGQFQAIVDSIKRGIDVLIGQPLTLAFQVKLMVQAPARALADIRARLGAYGNLASQIFGQGVSSPGGVGNLGPGPNAGGIGSVQTGGTAGSANDSQSPNTFHTLDLFASTMVTGSILSILNNRFTVATEAADAATALAEQFEALQEWRDDNYESLSGQTLTVEQQAEFIVSPQAIDLGEGYQALQQAVSLALGYLIEASFDLKQETRVVLARARTPLDFVAEVYRDLDQLDFFIETNDLTGSEILELPKGKEIVYYI